MTSNNFLGFDYEFWNFIRKWNIGLVAVFIFLNLFPNQGMKGKDILLYFVMFNAPLWTFLALRLFFELKERSKVVRFSKRLRCGSSKGSEKEE